MNAKYFIENACVYFLIIKVEQERLVYLNEDAVRKLFRIPYKILDPNQQNDEV